jgi:hypothetical protein
MGYNIFCFLQTSNVEKIKIYRTVHIFPVFGEKIHQISKTKENWNFFNHISIGNLSTINGKHFDSKLIMQ